MSETFWTNFEIIPFKERIEKVLIFDKLYIIIIISFFRGYFSFL